jgi:hypothetical protein
MRAAARIIFSRPVGGRKRDGLDAGVQVEAVKFIGCLGGFLHPVEHHQVAMATSVPILFRDVGVGSRVDGALARTF